MHCIQLSSLVYLNLQEFFSLSLCFIALAFLKRTGQLFYEILFNLGLSDTFDYDFNSSVPQFALL